MTARRLETLRNGTRTMRLSSQAAAAPATTAQTTARARLPVRDCTSTRVYAATVRNSPWARFACLVTPNCKDMAIAERPSMAEVTMP